MWEASEMGHQYSKLPTELPKCLGGTVNQSMMAAEISGRSGWVARSPNGHR